MQKVREGSKNIFAVVAKGKSNKLSRHIINRLRSTQVDNEAKIVVVYEDAYHK